MGACFLLSRSECEDRVLEQEAMEEEEEDGPWKPCLKLKVIQDGVRQEDSKYLVTRKEQGAKLAGALVATKREEREDVVAPIYVGTVFHVDRENRQVRVNREVFESDKVYRGVAPMTMPKGADRFVYGFYKVDELVELEQKSLQELEKAGVTGGCACPVEPSECYACVLASKSVEVEEGGEGEASSSGT